MEPSEWKARDKQRDYRGDKYVAQRPEIWIARQVEGHEEYGHKAEEGIVSVWLLFAEGVDFLFFVCEKGAAGEGEGTYPPAPVVAGEDCGRHPGKSPGQKACCFPFPLKEAE